MTISGLVDSIILWNSGFLLAPLIDWQLTTRTFSGMSFLGVADWCMLSWAGLVALLGEDVAFGLSKLMSEIRLLLKGS